MKKFAIIVSGAGVKNGTENNELTLALLSISQLGGEYEIFAPNAQYELGNPFTGEPNGIEGNILYESAKITRGEVKDLSSLNVENFDGLVMPGGFGAVKNLSNIYKYIENHDNNTESEIIINSDVKRTIEDFYKHKKFIVAICISPIVVASVIRDCTITLGSIDNKPKNFPIDLHCVACDPTSYIFDDKHRVYTTPAFMSTNNLSIMFRGIHDVFVDLFGRKGN